MTARGPQTAPCDAATGAGRLRKARQFLAAADLLDADVEDATDLADAYVTLCVHAGIAAADALCCARMGRHARGQDHGDAIDLVKRVQPEAAKDLSVLLRMKTRAGYSGVATSIADRRRAGRAAHRLVETARRSS